MVGNLITVTIQILSTKRMFCFSKAVYYRLVLLFFVSSIHITSEAFNSNYKEIPTDQSLVIDPYFSPYTGVSIGLFTRSLLNYATPEIAKDKITFTIGWEVIKSFCDIPITMIPMYACGSYFRLKTLADKPNKYLIKGFLPNPPKFSKDNNYDVALLVGLGNLEYLEILNQAFFFDFLGKSYRNRPIACSIVAYPLLYYFKIGNSICGIIDEPIIGGSYVKTINSKHKTTKRSLGDNDIRVASIIDLGANLLIYVSDFLLIKENHEIRYLPLWVTKFTPFGISYGLDNYLVLPNKMFLFSIQVGKSPFYTQYYGTIGVKTDGLYTYKKYTFDIKTQLWYQPGLLLKKQDVLEDKNYLGGLIGFSNKLRLTENLGLFGAFLYKTKGYCAGKITQNGFIWEAGITLNYTSSLLDI